MSCWLYLYSLVFIMIREFGLGICAPLLHVCKLIWLKVVLWDQLFKDIDKSFVEDNILKHEILRDIHHQLMSNFNANMKSMVNFIFLKFWMVGLLKTLHAISYMNINIPDKHIWRDHFLSIYKLQC